MDRAAGLVPFLVVGSSGTTNTGAVDDLRGWMYCCTLQPLLLCNQHATIRKPTTIVSVSVSSLIHFGERVRVVHTCVLVQACETCVMQREACGYMQTARTAVRSPSPFRTFVLPSAIATRLQWMVTRPSFCPLVWHSSCVAVRGTCSRLTR